MGSGALGRWGIGSSDSQRCAHRLAHGKLVHRTADRLEAAAPLGENLGDARLALVDVGLLVAAARRLADARQLPVEPLVVPFNCRLVEPLEVEELAEQLPEGRPHVEAVATEAVAEQAPLEHEQRRCRTHAHAHGFGARWWRDGQAGQAQRLVLTMLVKEIIVSGRWPIDVRAPDGHSKVLRALDDLGQLLEQWRVGVDADEGVEDRLVVLRLVRARAAVLAQLRQRPLLVDVVAQQPRRPTVEASEGDVALLVARHVVPQLELVLHHVVEELVDDRLMRRAARERLADFRLGLLRDHLRPANVAVEVADAEQEVQVGGVGESGLQVAAVEVGNARQEHEPPLVALVVERSVTAAVTASVDLRASILKVGTQAAKALVLDDGDLLLGALHLALAPRGLRARVRPKRARQLRGGGRRRRRLLLLLHVDHLWREKKVLHILGVVVARADDVEHR